MQVPHNKDLASHVVLESCAAHREVRREALTEVCIGQPSSHDSVLVPGADAVLMVEGNMSERVSRASGRPGVVGDPGMCRSSLYGNREISGPTSCGIGLARVGKAKSRSRR